MKSMVWLYQNEHFQEIFILIQPPTPLYQMEHFQNLCFSNLFVEASVLPVNHGASRPTITGVWGRAPSEQS